MPPLTSPPDCDSCVHLTQNIKDLEGRIQKDKKLLGTLVSFGPALLTTVTELDSTIPCTSVPPI